MSAAGAGCPARVWRPYAPSWHGTVVAAANNIKSQDQGATLAAFLSQNSIPILLTHQDAESLHRLSKRLAALGQ